MQTKLTLRLDDRLVKDAKLYARWTGKSLDGLARHAGRRTRPDVGGLASTLFLAMPVAWRGTLAQYVGRLHRLHPAKREVLVYDYADEAVPTLRRMTQKRIRAIETSAIRWNSRVPRMP